MKKITLGLALSAFMLVSGVGASYAVISNDNASTILVEKEKEKKKDRKKRKSKKGGCCAGKSECGAAKK